MRPTISASIAVICAALIVACGTTSQQKKSAARRPAQKVADAITALQRDLGTRNWRDLCEQVFSAEARRQAGGISCPSIVARESSGIRGPQIDIKGIEVNGHSAKAKVVTSAVGQAAVPETIDLVWENGAWRVSALAAR
jgi:hypothetical protein